LPKISAVNMPNKTRRYKRGGAPTGRTHVRSSHSDSVKALLSRVSGGLALARVSQQAGQQKKWRQWLEGRLPDELVAHLGGVVERDDLLVVFTESAVWSARVRYALAEIEPAIRAIRPQIRQVVVRVMPRN
jgi:hypothetical protein